MAITKMQNTDNQNSARITELDMIMSVSAPYGVTCLFALK